VHLLGIYKRNGGEVAIKVIDKLRFPHKEEAVLKNEVAILKVCIKYRGNSLCGGVVWW